MRDALSGWNQGLKLVAWLYMRRCDRGKLRLALFPLNLDTVAGCERLRWRFYKHDFTCCRQLLPILLTHAYEYYWSICKFRATCTVCKGHTPT